MKVKAIEDVKEYYTLSKGKEYEVRGLIYFATPHLETFNPRTIDDTTLRGLVTPVYSHGIIRNELVYVIETMTKTGRKTWMRFNTANFEVIDPAIPGSWSTEVIDLYEEMLPVRDALKGEYELENTINDLKQFNAKIIAIGDEEFRTPETLYAICDDNLEDESSQG